MSLEDDQRVGMKKHRRAQDEQVWGSLGQEEFPSERIMMVRASLSDSPNVN
jgi:hypothetical protein